MTKSHLDRLEPLRRAGQDLCHEIKNQLGVAMGSMDLIGDTIEDGQARKDLERALHALSELNLLITEAQVALRRERWDDDRPDVGVILRECLDQFAEMPGHEGKGIRHKLPDKPVVVRFPEETLRTLLFSLLLGSHDEALDLLLQEELSEPDAELGKGRYCALLSKGGRTRSPEEGWSFEVERFRIRTLGGDLRSVPEGLLLILPLGACVTG